MTQIRLRLKDLMIDRGLTQLELSEAIDVPQGTISKWVGNKVDRYDGRILKKLCDYFDVGIGELLVYTPDKGKRK